MNPKVTNVVSALDRINKTSPTKEKIAGTITMPDWFGVEDHIQGVAPINGTTSVAGCISGSSTDGGYFATFSKIGSNTGTVDAVTIGTDRPVDYDHGSGVQLLDRILPFGIESDVQSDKGKVHFYDLSTLSDPFERYTLTMDGRKASATAITNVTLSGKEKALLAVYLYDPEHMAFFLADYDKVAGTQNPFGTSYTYTGKALDDGDQYQNFALVTDTNNVVWLLGFREDEELHLFQLTITENTFTVDLRLEKVYKGWSGADWRNGVGAQIVDASTIRLFGTDKDPSGDDDDYSFHVYVWA